MTSDAKQKINNVIFERAYEIEQQLSEDNFFLAKMCGLRPDQVEDVALNVAIKELQKEFSGTL